MAMTTIRKFREILDIVAKYSSLGEEEWNMFTPEHDCIYLNITNENVPKDSEDGKRLKKLGCIYDFEGLDCWGMFI